jgi:aminopeptidase-like protein
MQSDPKGSRAMGPRDSVSARAASESGSIGSAMHSLVADLYPICRSITGDGVRRTLDILKQHIPLRTTEVPSGTPAFDWVVPREWNIRDAYVRNARGEKVIDFQQSNLHLLNYSTPVDRQVPLAELRQHLFQDSTHPDRIPYRTSYYAENWGFCVTRQQFESLNEPEYEVHIDSSLTDGSLTYGECLLRGASEDEVLISCHVCHPSLANDNLSGISVAVHLAKWLQTQPRRLSYRLLFAPGTIGAITWLSRNRDITARIRHGLVLTCVGDPGSFHYKKSRRGNAEIDRAVAYVLSARGVEHEIRPFHPYGYDERQYCSPGFNLPVGCLMRSAWGEFPEYHTSADNVDFVTPSALAGTLDVCKDLVDLLERNLTYRSTNPFCEPALGRRGLYRSTGGSGIGDENLARLWILNLADGGHTLLDVAERSGLSFALLAHCAEELAQHGLLTPVPSGENRSE